MDKPQKLQSSLYKGTEDIVFYPNSKRFKRGDDWIPSVTTGTSVMNKPQLIYQAVYQTADYLLEILDAGAEILVEDINRAKKLHTVRKNTAQSIGEIVHDWCLSYINGNDPGVPHESGVAIHVLGFLTWVDENQVRFVNRGRTVYSKKHNFAGRITAEAEINGKLCIIDLRVSKRIKCTKCKAQCAHKVVAPEWLFQTAACQKAAQEEGYRYPGDRRILRFDKFTGELEVYRCRGIQPDWNAFLGCLAILNGIKRLQ